MKIMIFYIFNYAFCFCSQDGLLENSWTLEESDSDEHGGLSPGELLERLRNAGGAWRCCATVAAVSYGVVVSCMLFERLGHLHSQNQVDPQRTFTIILSLSSSVL